MHHLPVGRMAAEVNPWGGCYVGKSKWVKEVSQCLQHPAPSSSLTVSSEPTGPLWPVWWRAPEGPHSTPPSAHHMFTSKSSSGSSRNPRGLWLGPTSTMALPRSDFKDNENVSLLKSALLDPSALGLLPGSLLQRALLLNCLIQKLPLKCKCMKANF